MGEERGAVVYLEEECLQCWQAMRRLERVSTRAAKRTVRGMEGGFEAEFAPSCWSEDGGALESGKR